MVKEERGPEGWFRVEGSVIPNLPESETPAAIDISVPILLSRSTAEWEPDENVVREVELDRVRPAALDAVSTHGQSEDSFSAASGALERISDLRSRGILDEPNYLELKNAIIAKMKSLIGAPLESEIPKPGNSAFHAGTVPYAQLHAQIVDLIADSYASGSDPKSRAQHALREMNKLGALNSGDPPLLMELLDTALADTNEKSPAELLSEVSHVAAKIRTHPASPVSKAIAETAEQSGRRAAEEYESKQKSEKPGLISTLWRRLVWPDVEGAFSGGAAGASISPALAAHQVLWPVQIAAAFGVMIGAGLRSGMAYGESRERSGAVRGA